MHTSSRTSPKPNRSSISQALATYLQQPFLPKTGIVNGAEIFPFHPHLRHLLTQRRGVLKHGGGRQCKGGGVRSLQRFTTPEKSV